METGCTHRNPAVHQLVITWSLVPIVAFLAARGFLWFQGAVNGNLVAGGFSQLAKQQGSAGGAPPIAAATLIVCAIIIPWIRPIVRRLWHNVIFLVYGVYALTSTIWSQEPEKTFIFGCCMFVNILFAFYLVSRFPRENQMAFLLQAGLFILVLSTLLAMFFPEYGTSYGGSTEGWDANPWKGLFPHKNACAVVLVYLLSVALYLPSQSSNWKIVRVIYIALSLVLILNTQSRTGWILCLALFAFRGLTGLVNVFRLRDMHVIAILLLLVVCLVTPWFVDNYAALTYLIDKDPTLTGRVGAWTITMVSILKHPVIGYGYAGFWNGLHGESASVSLTLGYLAPGVDNGYLYTWLELGAVGLVLFSFSLARAIRDAVYCLHHSGRSNYVHWCVSVIGLCMVSNTVEKMIMIPNYLPWIMYIMACAGLAEEARRSRRSTAERGRLNERAYEDSTGADRLNGEGQGESSIAIA
jgi:exopolysaccharide production protein ExoQ